MATKKTAAEECCAKCEKDIAALKKEIAALKKELKVKSSGGADPRVDLIVKYLTVSYDENVVMQEKRKKIKEIIKSL